MKYDMTPLEKGMDQWGIKITSSQMNKFEHYLDALLEWNQKINLTAITEPKQIIVQHFLDSISAMDTGYLKSRHSLVDIGTGAGFPGVPIKIMMPDIKILLLDSLKKGPYS